MKPANVMFTEYDEPQLGDLGIARLVDAATTATGSVHATLEYAAPEVLSGQPATPASDVYGLGATLHAALGGASPVRRTGRRAAGGPGQSGRDPARRPTSASPGSHRGSPPSSSGAWPRTRPTARPRPTRWARCWPARPSTPGATAAHRGRRRRGRVLPPTAALDATAVQVPVGGAVAHRGGCPDRPGGGGDPERSGPPAPRRRRDAEGSGRRGLALAAALVLLFLAAAGLAWALARDDEPSAGEATTTTDAPPSATTTTPDDHGARRPPRPTAATTAAHAPTPATSAGGDRDALPGGGAGRGRRLLRPGRGR